MFCGHALQIAVFGEEERIGRRYKLGLLEVDQVDKLSIIVADF